MRLPVPRVRLRRPALLLVLAAMIAVPWLLSRTSATVTSVAGSNIPFANRVDNGNDSDAAWPNPRDMKQADRVANLGAFANDPTGSIIPSQLRTRPALLRERARLQAAGDV